MAESNAPEQTDRGLFGLFGKKKEDETPQQFPTPTNPTESHGNGQAGQLPYTPTPAQTTPAYPKQAYGHSGDDVQHATPPPRRVDEVKYGDEGEKKFNDGNNSSSSSSDEEEEGGRKKKEGGRKKKGLKERLPGYKQEEAQQGYGENRERKAQQGYGENREGKAQQGYGENEGEKKGMVEKIKEKLPGHKTQQEKTQQY